MDNGNPPAQEQTVESNKGYNKNVESKIPYALTVTFKHLHCRTPRGQFYEVMPYLTKLLSKSTTFQLMPEWRVSNGSVHGHAVIYIKDRIKWIKQTLPSLKGLGFYLVKPIDNLDKWKEYILKEQYIAEQVVPMPYPIESEIKIVKQKDIKTHSVIDDYIIECLQEQSSPKKT